MQSWDTEKERWESYHSWSLHPCSDPRLAQGRDTLRIPVKCLLSLT